ncbi:MAG: HEAT repeat domain-containing protein [Planctomycetales bacterium]
MKLITIGLLAAAVIGGFAAPLWALGEEHFGNAPLPEANYAEWPGVMPLINNESRVYHTWVNGNEHFYYDGDLESLNAAIRQFSGIKILKREVVLRPGPAETGTFEQNKNRKIRYRWKLHLLGGIARHLATLPKGENIWRPAPVLTIYLDRQTPLAKLDIPKGVPVVGLGELKRRYAAALDSTDKTVRGWGTNEFATLDRYDPNSLATVVQMLDDEDDWVRLNAAGALAQFGAQAGSAVERLQQLHDTTGDANLKQTSERTIQAIGAAVDDAEGAKTHATWLRDIDQYLAKRRGDQNAESIDDRR